VTLPLLLSERQSSFLSLPGLCQKRFSFSLWWCEAPFLLEELVSARRCIHEKSLFPWPSPFFLPSLLVSSSGAIPPLFPGGRSLMRPAAAAPFFFFPLRARLFFFGRTCARCLFFFFFFRRVACARGFAPPLFFFSPFRLRPRASPRKTIIDDFLRPTTLR